MPHTLNLIVLGPSLAASENEAYAAVLLPLLGALAERGHRVAYLQPEPLAETPPGAALPTLPGIAGYRDLAMLEFDHATTVAEADVALVSSHLPEGQAVARWVLHNARGVRAYYDLDTPATLGQLAAGDFHALHPELIPRFDLYLSSTGGPWLNVLRNTYHPRRCEALYCSVDPVACSPVGEEPEFDLGYLGAFDGDRQPRLEELLLKPARQLPSGFFAVAGAGYPDSLRWPDNVLYVEHLPPAAHARFFAGQRYTLDLARREVLRAGWAPTPALFEAMAAGTPVISDDGRGLAEFFKIGQEVLVAHSAQDVLGYLTRLPEASRRRIAERARGRVLADHTAGHRAEELERLVRRILNDSARALART